MSGEMFDISELTEFTDRLSGLNDRTVNNKVKAMLRREGNKLTKKTINIATQRVKDQTGNYRKGIKRGKVYLYQGETWSIRTYNTQPHAHLIEDGHKTQNGGYVAGRKVFATAERQFQDEYFKDVDKFVDDLLKEGLGF